MERSPLIRRAALAALAVVVGLGLPWAAHAQEDDLSFTDGDVRACIEAEDVFVIVDPSDGELMGGCATEFATGMEALASAGFTVDDPAFIKVINGTRADYVKDGKWWTYWHRHIVDGAWDEWEFSQLGGASYEPQPGSVEGWSVSPASGPSAQPRWEGYDLNATPEPAPTPTVTVTVTAEPEPAPTVTVTETAQPIQTPPTEDDRRDDRSAPYTLPGLHEVNGRQWYTTCQKYSITERCRTEIWADTVVTVDGRHQVKKAWVFNNLTYVKSPRSAWLGNPLAETGEWTAEDGRQWRTECDTAATGTGACRSYVRATLISAQPDGRGGYRFTQVNDWTVNNIVLFS